jgi:hypothetical protein
MIQSTEFGLISKYNIERSPNLYLNKNENTEELPICFDGFSECLFGCCNQGYCIASNIMTCNEQFHKTILNLITIYAVLAIGVILHFIFASIQLPCFCRNKLGKITDRENFDGHHTKEKKEGIDNERQNLDQGKLLYIEAQNKKADSPIISSKNDDNVNVYPVQFD